MFWRWLWTWLWSFLYSILERCQVDFVKFNPGKGAWKLHIDVASLSLSASYSRSEKYQHRIFSMMRICTFWCQCVEKTFECIWNFCSWTEKLPPNSWETYACKYPWFCCPFDNIYWKGRLNFIMTKKDASSDIWLYHRRENRSTGKGWCPVDVKMLGWCWQCQLDFDHWFFDLRWRKKRSPYAPNLNIELFATVTLLAEGNFENRDIPRLKNVRKISFTFISYCKISEGF